MQITVYEESMKTRYSARGIGALVARFVGDLVILFIPFVIGYFMGEMWLSATTIHAFSDISYTGRLVAQVDTADGVTHAYITSASAMRALEDSILQSGGTDEVISDDDYMTTPPPAVSSLQPLDAALSVYVDDHNSNGYADSFTFTLQAPLDILTSPVTRACILPEFHARFKSSQVKVRMTTAPQICISGGPTGSGRAANSLRPHEAAFTSGELNFHETTLLTASPYVSYTHVYTESLFSNFTAIELAQMVPVAAAYSARNFSLSYYERSSGFGDYSLLDVSTTTVDHSGSLGMFTAEFFLRANDPVLYYTPAWYENFKHGYTQYFAIGYIIWWVIRFIRRVLVKGAIINTVAAWDHKTRN